MATFGDLTEEIIHNLSGYSTRSDSMATTTAVLSSVGLSVPVDTVDFFARGMVEIGSELVYVSGVDNATRSLIIPPWGRGYRGTKAVSHANGTRVTMAPSWARATVGRAINSTIRSLYPTLFGVKTLTLVTASRDLAYELPAEAERVLDVRHRCIGAPLVWDRVRKYDVLFGQTSSISSTGVCLELYDCLRPGTTVAVSYAVSPVELTDEDQDWSHTGLPASCYELAVLGATYRLLPYLDAVRLPTDSSSAVETDAQNQIGTAANLTKTYASMFADRLATEQTTLNDRYPARYRRVR